MGIMRIRKIIVAIVFMSSFVLFSCPQSTGGKSSHVHSMTHFDKVEATCKQEGKLEYWYCSTCRKDFLDENGNQEAGELSIARLEHAWERKIGAEKHWDLCSQCGDKRNEADHSGDPCSVCGYEDLFNIEDGVLTSLNASGKSKTQITIPDDVTTVRSSAFANLGNLRVVVVPESVKTIEANAFTGNPNLIMDARAFESKPYTWNSSFYGDNDKNCVVYSGGDWDDDCVYANGDVLVKFRNADLQFVTVPKRAKKLGKEGMDYVMIYGNEKSVFTSNQQVVNVSFEDGSRCESVSAYAFYGAKNLHAVGFPESLKDIGSGAFSGCNNLETVNFGQDSNLESIGADAFKDCTTLKNIVLPEGLKIIGRRCFDNCSVLESIEIPAGVKVLGEDTFSGCDKLSSVVLHEGLEEIGDSFMDGAFYDCDMLESIEIPSSCKKIGSHSFSSCSRLGTLILKEGLEEISESAFYCCKISSLSIPSTVRKIGDSAFYGNSLTELTLPAGITYGTSVFSRCEELSALTAVDGVEIINTSMFEGCSKLADVTLPATLKYLAEKCFASCTSTSFTVIKFAGTKAQWDAVDKHSDWKKDSTQLTKVQCSDGTFDL